MSTHYDFNIHWIAPGDIFSDPHAHALMNAPGLKKKPRGRYVALFRDHAAIEALGTASEAAQELMDASGFGRIPYDNGVAPGFYPPDDDAARLDVANRLASNLKRFGVRPEEFGAFDFDAFMDAFGAAEPLAETPPPAPVSVPRAANTDAADSRRFKRIAITLGCVLLAILAVREVGSWALVAFLESGTTTTVRF